MADNGRKGGSGMSKAHNSTPARERYSEAAKHLAETNYNRVCNYAKKSGLTYHQATSHWMMIQNAHGREKMIEDINSVVDERFKIIN